MSTPIYQVLPNVNVNKPETNNVNVNNVRATAHKLVERLDDPNSIKFFYKVARQLPEHVIWANVEQALTGRNPRAYFTFLCKLSMD